jgi:hypothetical protein
VATERLALTSSGQVRCQLKTPYHDGTTHIVMEPLDLMARLAALVPPPRMHLTRYHGVFAPHSQLRAKVTPVKRGVGAAKSAYQSSQIQQQTTPRHVAMNWARRLKRVFGVEIEGCARCGGKLKIIASIEEPAVIAKILAQLQMVVGEDSRPELAPAIRGRGISGRWHALRNGRQRIRQPEQSGQGAGWINPGDIKSVPRS